MLYFRSSFDVPIDQRDHFTIHFSDHVTERIETAHQRAGLSGVGDTLAMMGAWTAEQIADAEADALACMPPTIAVAGAAVDQYAIYDPESGEWVFTNFD
ncbi:hypothetical protein LIG30_4735 [Burkholderia sp. lig30]|jgi:hypothetical protein|uniref:hypothetical protein n=1 Tax=Burkholderia sp. lig30 TaxID=1192124 RepID=UPI000460F243|nr:hypothetical protein [Burkholderia sp. lig30]KDB05778.1 hypothetical protein LIG30_4735 [Burkholderia sp. lig30]